MKKLQNNQIDNLVTRRVTTDRLRRFVALMSAFVLFVTMNTLKLNADTLERIPTCGYGEHIHTEDCYDASGDVICGVEAHEHTDACYQQRPTGSAAQTRLDDYIPLNASVVLASAVDSSVSETEVDLVGKGQLTSAAASDDNGLSIDEQDVVKVAKETSVVEEDPETGIVAQPEAETELAPETRTETKSEIKTVTETESKSETEIELETETEDENETETEAPADETTEPEQEPEVEIGERAFMTLDEILLDAGLEHGAIAEVGIANEDADKLVVETAEDGSVTVVPLASFDRAEIVVIAEDGDYAIALVNAVVNVEEDDQDNNIEETDDETEQEPVEESAEETTEEVVEETTEETTEEVVEETTEETTEEVVEETTEETTEEVVEETTEETTEEVVEETTEETAEETVENTEIENVNDTETEENTEVSKEQTEVESEEKADDENAENADAVDEQTEVENENDTEKPAENDEEDVEEAEVEEIDEESTIEENEEADDEAEAQGAQVILHVDFSEVAKAGIDYAEDAVVSAAGNDGLALDVAELLNPVEETQEKTTLDVSVEDEGAELQPAVNADALEVVEVSGGVSFEDGAIAVTGDGSVALTDGDSTVVVNVYNVPELVENVTDGQGSITIEPVSDTAALPAGEAVFEAIEDEVNAEAKIADFRNEDAENPEIVETDDAGNVTVRTRHVQLFDIGVNSEGEAFEPGFAVRVRAEFDQPIEGQDFELYHIVDGEPELIKNAVVVSDQGATGLNFETDSFSPYAVVWYTVDFHFNGEDYSIPGESQILLSELIDRLNITNKDGERINVLDVDTVFFTNNTYVTVEQVAGLISYNEYSDVDGGIDVGEKDFLLTSHKPFITVESLIIIMNDDEIITIDVTDDNPIALQEIAKIVVDIETDSETGKYSRSSSLDFKVIYSISDLVEAKQHSPWVYDLSSVVSAEYLTLSNGESGVIRDGTKKVGTYEIKDNKVYINVDSTWLSNADTVNGDFELTIKVDSEKLKEQDKVEFKFPGNATVEVEFEKTTVETKKTVLNSKNGEKYNVVIGEDGKAHIEYEVEVKPNASFNSLIFTDTMSGQSLDVGSVKVYPYETWNTPYSVTPTTTSDGFTFDLATVLTANNDTIRANQTYYVRYSTTLPEGWESSETVAKNSATWSWTGEGNTKSTNETSVLPIKTTALSKTVAKTATANGDKKDKNDEQAYIYTLDYKVYVGDGSDLNGKTVKDSMKHNQQANGDIVIRNASGDEVGRIPAPTQQQIENGNAINGTVKITGTNTVLGTYTMDPKAYKSIGSDFDATYDIFQFTFAEGTTGKYTFEYQTKVDPLDTSYTGTQKIENNVSTSDGNSGKTEEYINFGNDDASIKKVWSDYLEYNGKNDGKMLEWKIYVTKGEGVNVLNDVEVIDYHPGWYIGGDRGDIDYYSFKVETASGELLKKVDSEADVTDPDGQYWVTIFEANNYQRTLHFKEVREDLIITVVTLDTRNDPLTTETFWNKTHLRVNGKDKNDSTAEKQFDINVDFDKKGSVDANTGVITWTVILNSVQKTIVPDYPVWFSDKIPEGMKVIGYDDPNVPQLKVTVNSKKYTDNRPMELARITANIDANGNIAPTEIPHKLEQSWDGTITAIEYGISDYTYTIEYKTVLTDEAKQAFANDDDGVITYKNEAYYGSDENTHKGETETTVDYQYKYLEKKDLGQTKDAIKYQIIINPDGIQLNGGDEIKLVDKLDSTNVDLSTSSVKVYYKGTSTEIEGVSISYDDDRRELTVYVPDETAVTVEYEVLVQNLGTDKFKNTATLYGTKTREVVVEKDHTITEHSAHISKTYSMRLIKIDKNNIAMYLSGAKFKLYEVPVTYTNGGTYVAEDAYETYTEAQKNGVIVNLGDPTEITLSNDTTGNTGELTFSGLTGYSKLYYWVETEAPEGYTLDNTRHYFILYEEDEDATIEAKNKNKADVLDKAAERALAANGVSPAIVNKTTVGSDWTVVNEMNGIGLTVKKKWLNETGAEKEFEENKTIYFSIYQKVGDGQATVYTYNGNNVHSLTYDASEKAWSEFQAKGLPKEVNGQKAVYYVVETNANGVALSSDETTSITYRAGVKTETETAADAWIDKQSSIIITNADNTSVEVKKVWKNAEGTELTVDAAKSANMPAVTVKLKKNDSVVETVTLDASNDWSHKWFNLKTSDNYTIEEGSITGYELDEIVYKDAEGNTNSSYQVIQTDGSVVVYNKPFKPDETKTNVTVKKVWYDENGEMSEAATQNLKAKVQLIQYSTPVTGLKLHFVTGDNKPYTTIKVDNTKDVTVKYTVTKNGPNCFVSKSGQFSYSSDVSEADKIGSGVSGNWEAEKEVTFTLSKDYIEQYRDLYVVFTSVREEWHSKNQISNISATPLATGGSAGALASPYGDPIELTSDMNNSFEYTFYNLPVESRDGDYVYTYAIDEVEVGDNFETKYYVGTDVSGEGKDALEATDAKGAANQTFTFTVKNTQTTPQLGSLKITKTVVGPQGVNPDDIEFTVKGPAGFEKTFTWARILEMAEEHGYDSEHNTRYVKFENLTPGEYTVTETKSDAKTGYYKVVTTYTVDGEDEATGTSKAVTLGAGQDIEVAFTNTYTELTDFAVQKRWIKEKADGTGPDLDNPDFGYTGVSTIWFNLYRKAGASGTVEYVGTYSITSAKQTVSAGADGDTVSGEPKAYDSTNEIPQNWLTVIEDLPLKNASDTPYDYYALECVDASGKIKMADGDEIKKDDSRIKLGGSGSDNWDKAYWSNILYYQAAYCRENYKDADVQAIKNMLVHVKVTKVWDNSGVNSLTHPAVTLRLNKQLDGESTVTPMDGYVFTIEKDSAELTKDWGYLPAYDYTTGKKITYSVTEDAVTGFKTEITCATKTDAGCDYEYAFTVKNTWETTDITVEKKWKNLAGNDITSEQGEVSFTLYQVGATTTATIGTYTTSNHTWSSKEQSVTLPKYYQVENGVPQLYLYYVVESDLGVGFSLVSYQANSTELTSQSGAINESTAAINGGTITLTNQEQQTYSLPSTGGTGTTVFYGAGASLMLFAFLGFVLNARKRSRGEGI